MDSPTRSTFMDDEPITHGACAAPTSTLVGAGPIECNDVVEVSSDAPVLVVLVTVFAIAALVALIAVRRYTRPEA